MPGFVKLSQMLVLPWHWWHINPLVWRRVALPNGPFTSRICMSILCTAFHMFLMILALRIWCFLSLSSQRFKVFWYCCRKFLLFLKFKMQFSSPSTLFLYLCMAHFISLISQSCQRSLTLTSKTLCGIGNPFVWNFKKFMGFILARGDG